MADVIDNLLDVIYQLESSGGKNPQAYKENKYGAKGGYQIRRSTYEKDITRYNPKWKQYSFDQVAADDNLSRQAARDYINLMSEYLATNNIGPTRENLLQSYHAGMGNVVRGKIGPATNEYLLRARQLMLQGQGR